MADYGLAILSGLLGGAGGGLAKGIQLGDEEALKRERLAEEKRQFDESQYTDLGALIPGMGKVRTSLAPHVLAAREKETERARAAQLGQTLKQQVLEQAQGGPQPGTTLAMPAPGDLVRTPAPMGAVARPRDENLAALARFIPTLAQLSPKDTTEAVLSRFGPQKGIVTAPGSQLRHPVTGAPLGEPTPRERKVSSHLIDRPEGTFNLVLDDQGNTVSLTPVSGLPAKPPKEPDQGQRREQRIRDYLVNVKKLTPGSPAYQEAFLILEQQAIPVEGIGPFAKIDLLPGGGGRGAPSAPAPSGPGSGGPAVPTPAPTPPGGPQPRIAADRPVSGETTQQIIGASRLKSAAQKIEAALRSPDIKEYLGPYAQYRALAQEKAPYSAMGKVPAPVIDLEQNLATVQNYTIRLITGAQMNINEETRIKKELPQMGQPEYMFRQRWDTTKANIAQLEKIVTGLALSGNQRAKAVALEFGLIQGEQGQVGGSPRVRWGRDPKTGQPVPLP